LRHQTAAAQEEEAAEEHGRFVQVEFLAQGIADVSGQQVVRRDEAVAAEGVGE
jgi:hypothetical protein